MFKVVWILLLPTVILVILSITESIAYGATEKFDISGVVVNNTGDSSPVGGAMVTLNIRRLNNEIEIQHATTAKDGTFVFESVDSHDDALYEVFISFDGVVYRKNLGSPLNDSGQITMILTVYSASDSSDIVSIFNTSILFTDVDVKRSRIYVMEMVTLHNETDFTYIPGDGPMELLRFGLPIGSEGLYVETDIPQADWVQVDKGFALITPIIPGKHELLYTYNFPYEGTREVINRRWRYGAENLRILIPSDLANIKVDLGTEATNINIEGMEYLVVEGVNIQRNQDVIIQLTNLPERNLIQKIISRPEKVNYYYSAPVALVLSLLIFIVIAIVRVTRSSNLLDNETGSLDEQKIIKDMINKLDTDLGNGRISKSEHERKLYVLTRRITEILRK